jgi:serine/threonine protein kinase
MINTTIRIKGYDRVEQIAQGRHAVVFRAHDSTRKREVVFKVLLPHLAEDQRFLPRFKRAVQIATKIEHENLVNVLLCGHADVSYFVAFEHYNGVTLEKILSDRPRIPVEIAVQIVLGLAAGLEACHRNLLIHRDVRPGNVILTRTGGVKLDNLTLAADVSEPGRVAFAGRVSNTVAYMSPEQTLGENLGFQSDVFSLGVVAWELLSGASAFGSGSPAAVAERIRTTTLKRLSEVNPIVEPALCDIVARMIDREITHRYPSAVDVAADLRQAMSNLRYRQDAKTMTRFVEDPAAYTDSSMKHAVEALKEKVAAAGEENPATLIGYYEKLAFLEPGNPEYPREISRLKAAAQEAEKSRTSPALGGADTGMTYRVIIESLDPKRESPASFSLKLATKLRVPLSVVKPFVDNMPAALPGEHMHRKAVYVAKILEELGAVTRIEAYRPTPERIVCPKCGTEADPKAELCATCQHPFISVVDLHPGLGETQTEPPPEAKESGGTNSFLQRLLGALMKRNK